MLNITDDVEQKWVNFSKDEAYLIRYVNPDTYQSFTNKDGNLKDVEKLVDFIVQDWKGIQVKQEKKVVDFECTKENKVMLFDKFPSRWGFILRKSLDFNTFFDLEANEKN